MNLSFRAAMKETVLDPSIEGGAQLSKISNDPGGLTFAGIARNKHPNWFGWKLIEQGEALDSLRLSDLVEQFYLENFWTPINGNNLPPRIAQQVFDFAINSGVETGKKALQRALGTVKVDGEIGGKTIAAVRTIDQKDLVLRFLAERSEHFAKTPQAKSANVGGWFNRLAIQLRRGAA